MQKIQNILQETIHTLYEIDFSPEISPAPKVELGEYCINIFPIVKHVGKAPNIISAEVATELEKNNEIFVSTNATGGYVNFFLANTVWVDIFQSVKDETPKIQNKETIIVDYIGMNVGKPPHIGHICTPLQWQSIINILRYQGHHIISDSHLGDWGYLFGKLIIWYKKYGDKHKLEEDAINHLLEIYIAINTDAEADERIEQACRDAFRELSLGNKEYTSLWAEFTTASIATNKKMLELMHIHQDYDIGESYYEGIDLPKIWKEPPLQFDMNSIVDELIEKWIATKNQDGSVGVVFPEATKMPSTILRKKDGTNLYLTSDLAAIKYRITNGWNPSRILYFVDVRQSLHLKQAFWIARSAWWMPDIELTHAANGAIVLPEGAMSTRKWNIIRLDALVEEGYTRVKKILEEKWRNLTSKDITEIAIGAIKYSYLSQDRERDVVFGWDKALSFEGNSGPYIQYAYVRAKKIAQNTLISFSETIENLSPYDKSLIQTLAKFESVVDTVAKTYKPHHLALYAYDLAVGFNSFYVHTPKILEESDENMKSFRLMLVSETAKRLEKAFDLLGIKMPSEM
jgi:arginyl-tRNA synthetase